MDEITFKVLEYEKILLMVAAFSTTAEGREEVQSLRPLGDYHHLLERLSCVAECRRLLTEGRTLGIEPMDPMRPLFEKLRPEDAVLEGLELRAFIPLLSSAEALKRLLPDIREEVLKAMIKRIHTHPELRRQIERSIERDGSVKDEASPELYEIRRMIQRVDRRIKSILESILEDPHLTPHIQDFYITERNGRRVIPVKHDSKGHIRGVIHDISNTGETVFVEPREAVQLGNELESLRAEEKLEEFRVLKGLSSMIRDLLDRIEADHSVVIELDMLQSLARFAEHIGAELPEINRSGMIEIRRGRHPLLWKSLRAAGREDELVPLDFTLGRQYTGLVITGPNAGGKTVVLKTVGVIVLMALSGIPVPAASGTSVPFLHSVLADIGDEQSIEANISTFSGHVLRLKEILHMASEDSLVIVDELGTGTDPDEGAALGCAILRRLKHRGALTLVSTHLGLVKAFAFREEGLENGSMLMEENEEDPSRYRPTYRLQIGIAGQSHALEIAKRLGMPAEIIEEARGLLGNKERYLEDLLASLNQKEMILEKEIEEARRIKRELLDLREKLRDEIDRIKADRRDILKKMARRADEYYRRAVNEAETLLKRIKEQKDRQRARALMKTMIEKRQEIKRLAEPPPPRRRGLERIEAGATAYIGRLGMVGVIKTVNPSSKRCRVVVMGKELDIPFDDLYEPDRVAEKEIKEEERSLAPLPEKIEAPGPVEVNLRGMHVDEALSELERYLNDASLSGVPEIRVIHGIGTGALSRAIREYLKGHPLVSSFRPGRKEEGGDGVTVVNL